MRALSRYRIRLSRSWWPWILVAVTLGCLGATQVSSGWVSNVAAVGCLLSLVALWLIVTIRRDRLLQDAVEDAGDNDTGGAGEGADADGLEGVEAGSDH